MSNLRDERTDELIGAFRTQFQSEPTHVASGPGRVNLIGEHTDYNDGFVLPVALKRDVRFVFRPRADRQVRLSALEFDEQFAFDLDAMAYVAEPLWANYVMGMAWSLEQAGLHLTGIDAVVSGNVPRGSGLSSSAAVEVSGGPCLPGRVQSTGCAVGAADRQSRPARREPVRGRQLRHHGPVHQRAGPREPCAAHRLSLAHLRAGAHAGGGGHGHRQHPRQPLAGQQRLQRTARPV